MGAVGSDRSFDYAAEKYRNSIILILIYSS